MLFFGADGVDRELLYSEFEALLDSFVPLKEWADSTAKAVYVEIDSQFNVVAAVFFLVGFDSKGNVEASWNMPLADLARTSHKGPDLGSGPIHLASASHCPVAYYNGALWDPEPGADGFHFSSIQASIKRNKLGVAFKESAVKDTPSRGADNEIERLLSRKYEREMRETAAELLQEQKLRFANLANEKESTIAALKRECAKQLGALQAQLAQKQELLDDVQKRNEELKETVTGQAQKVDGLREYYEHKLSRLQQPEDVAAEFSGGITQAELDARLQSAVQESKEQLRMQQIELQCRIDLQEQMQAELVKLREQVKQLLEGSAERELEELSRQGVSFVTYQAGAGHITIPLTDLNLFKQNPVAFTAAYCAVEESVYRAWLQHYQAPVCVFVDEQGRACAADLERVATPAEFVRGISEYCERHQPSARPAPAVDASKPPV